MSVTKTQSPVAQSPDRTVGYVNPITHYLEINAGERSAAVAVSYAGQRLTYQELNQRANRLAHYLIAQGVSAEIRVGVCLKASFEVAVSLLAILKAGGVYVPLDPNDPAERIATILEDNKPRLVLTQSYLTTNLPHDNSEPLFQFDTDSSSLESYSTENPQTTIDLNQTAYLVYTSGTTGKPKGVMASHRNLLHYILSAHDRYGIREHDTMPALARFTFSISLLELLSPLVAGGRLILLDRDDVLNFKSMVKVLDETTIIHASPSWWRNLLGYLLNNHSDSSRFRHLRHVSAGGDTVPGDLLEMMKTVFPAAEVFVIYGCTEVSCMACTYLARRDQTTTKAWLGQPFPQVEVCLYDEHEQLIAEGEEGEIYIAGEGVTKGYLNLPSLTQEKFVTIEGKTFYCTGDLGRWVEGNLQILGRVDFQIQLRGIRIEPGEIETHLRRAPGVRDGLVAARKMGASEKSLVAYLVLEEPGKLDLEEVRNFLKAHLPDYMLPAAYVVLKAIPVNLNQKVDRQALPAPTSANIVRVGNVTAPRDEYETELVAIWEKTLGVQPVGIHNSFFDLGGDSLQAIQILLQVEARWRLDLPITVLLEAHSVEALAKVVREGKFASSRETRGASDVVCLRRGANKAPLFCLQGLLLYQELARALDEEQPVYAVYLQEEIELIKAGRYESGDSVFSTIPRLAARYLYSIRTVQPHGPYYLSGSSFAGLVAFEMAQQLKDVGEEVRLIALFDSMMMRKIPLRRRLQCHWDLFREQGASYLFRKITNRWNKVLQVTNLSQTGARKPPAVARAAPRTNITDQETVLDEVSALAAQSYVPRPYHGRIILFRATDQSFFNQDSPDLGWTPYAKGDFKIHHIPGTHMGILKGLSASILARELEPYLDTY